MTFGLYWSSMKKMDWQIMVAAFLLISMGCIAMYSVGLGQEENGFLYLKKQLIGAGVGIVFLFFLAFFNYRFFSSSAKLIYFLSILLLLLLLFFGTTIRGTRGWFVFSGFNIQPVELIKVFLVFFFSWFFSHFGRFLSSMRYLVLGGLYFFPIALLVLFQPDLGSVALLFSLWLFYVLISGIRRWQIALLLGVFFLVSVTGWIFFLEPYQKERVLTFLNPERDPYGQGYNVTQAAIAIGSGGWYGKGLGFGSQSQLKFLPEAHTDFVFAVIAEELGFIGSALLLFLFSFLFYRLFRALKNSRDDFSFFLLLGVLILFSVQTLINIGMNLGLLPVTGLSLPFVSYGGSSLVASLMLIGVAQSVIIRSKGVIGV